MMLDDYKRIWIIGASSGIGLALTNALDATNRTLVLSARRKSLLEQIAIQLKANTVTLPFDITDEYAVGAAAQEIADTLQGVDMVIINAGTCEYIDGPDLDVDLTKRVMNTNYLGAVTAISNALPLLRAAKSEHFNPKIVVMSSSVTYQALPRAHAYGASKAALRYFTECLKIDLDQEGIDTHIVSPGFVKTPLTDLNDFPMPFRISSNEAAEMIISGLKNNDFDVHFPKRFTRMLKLLSLLPTKLRYHTLNKMARDENQDSLGNSL